MNKQQFIEIMEELISIKNDQEALNKALHKFDPDFNYFSFGRFECLLGEAVKIAMDDKYDNISYWLYELNCGKDAKKNSVTKDGKPIPIKTLSNLYDLIKADYWLRDKNVKTTRHTKRQ